MVGQAPPVEDRAPGIAALDAAVGIVPMIQHPQRHRRMLVERHRQRIAPERQLAQQREGAVKAGAMVGARDHQPAFAIGMDAKRAVACASDARAVEPDRAFGLRGSPERRQPALEFRSEEHTSELQSLMRISYAVFCLKKKKNMNN